MKGKIETLLGGLLKAQITHLYKEYSIGLEMVQQVGALIALPEDLVSVPSTYIRQLTIVCNSSPCTHVVDINSLRQAHIFTVKINKQNTQNLSWHREIQ